MGDFVTTLHTDSALLRALQDASKRRTSEEELRQQRVSFIMGTLKDTSGVTRSRIQDVLAQQEGRHPA